MMKKKIVIIIALIILVGAAAFFFLSQDKGLEVNGVEVRRGNLEDYVEENGTVMTRNNIQVYSPIAGKVTEVFVDVGDAVVEGDVLAKLDGETLALQLGQLDAQRSALVAGLNEAKKTGDANTIKSLQLDIDQLTKTIQDEEANLKDVKALYQAGAISEDQLKASERSLQSQKTNLEKMKLQLKGLNSPVSQNLIAQYQAQIKQIDLQKQELASSGDDFTIRAGTTGTVLQKTVQKGSILQPGISLMELGDTEDLYIQSDILVSEIFHIKEGLLVRLINEDLGIETRGKVEKIHPNAFSKISDLGVEQKRITLDIEMDTIAEGLRPGYDLEVRIIIKSSNDTLIIPENSVFSMENKDYVFVDKGGVAKLREIETGIQSGRDMEVLLGLGEGELVIQSPDGELEDGMKIQVRDNI